MKYRFVYWHCKGTLGLSYSLETEIVKDLNVGNTISKMSQKILIFYCINLSVMILSLITILLAGPPCCCLKVLHTLQCHTLPAEHPRVNLCLSPSFIQLFFNAPLPQALESFHQGSCHSVICRAVYQATIKRRLVSVWNLAVLLPSPRKSGGCRHTEQCIT